jgi:hypothetical protein
MATTTAHFIYIPTQIPIISDSYNFVLIYTSEIDGDPDEMVEVTIGNILSTYMDDCGDTEDTDHGSGSRISPSEESLRLYFVTSSQHIQIQKDVLTSLSNSYAIRSDARTMLLDVLPRRRISDLDSLSLLSPETSTVHVSIPTFLLNLRSGLQHTGILRSEGPVTCASPCPPSPLRETVKRS